MLLSKVLVFIGLTRSFRLKNIEGIETSQQDSQPWTGVQLDQNPVVTMGSGYDLGGGKNESAKTAA